MGMLSCLSLIGQLKTGKLVWDVFIVMENEKADLADLNECKKILKRGAVQCEPSDILLIMDGG